jgi:hypothetical protein
MTYRAAADVLAHLLPIDAGRIAETLRSHTPRVGEQLSDAASDQPAAAVAAITVNLDSTLIRSREEGKRHLEVRVGNVETAGGGRQVFGAVAKADTDGTALIRRNLETVGRTADTEVIAFTDGCPRSAVYPGDCRSYEATDSRLVPPRDAVAAGIRCNTRKPAFCETDRPYLRRASGPGVAGTPVKTALLPN